MYSIQVNRGEKSFTQRTQTLFTANVFAHDLSFRSISCYVIDRTTGTIMTTWENGECTYTDPNTEAIIASEETAE